VDFFEAQAQAHRTTLRLIALFAAAVASLVLLTVGLVAAVIAFNTPPTGVVSVDKVLGALSPTLVLGIAGGVVVIVAIASTFRLMTLSNGGRSVAEALGGRLVQPNTDDAAEKRLRNVVEEMAIASGVPVPPIYVIDEDGINAFAAGYSPDDAVIGITRGALETLDRRELQGVVAHEFSHVLNGDARLNLRLVAVLFGILVIGILGRSLIGGRGRRHRSSGRGGSGTAQVAVLALGLMIIGYLGSFFGGLIKAAVSRQREFLADASAVQFTRDPTGIAGALRKIGGLGAGSRLGSARADEMSHLFFGQAIGSGLFGLMATHPPLEARIRAVDPAWDGEFPIVTPHRETPESAAPAASADPLDIRETATAGVLAGGAMAAGGAPGSRSAPSADDAGAGGTTGTEVAAHLGRVTPEDVDHAQELIGGIPAPLHDAAHDPFGARAAIYALVLSPEPVVRARQRDLVGERAETGVPALLDELLEARAALPDAARLPLAHLAVPALKQLSEAQYRRFRALLADLIKADEAISRFEWVLHQVLLKELRGHFEAPRRRAGRARPEQERAACAVLLSALARTGTDDPQAAREAVAAGAEVLGVGPLEADLEADPNQSRLTDALRRLRRLHPLAVPRLLKAAVTCVERDGVVRPAERDLLQGVAAVLDCPLPPLGMDAALH
jgi:Zn-dependent protease with chaperone function